MALNVTPGTGEVLKTILDSGEHVTIHAEDATQRAALVAAITAAGGTLPTGAATQATLASILAKIITAPATEAKQDTIIGFVDGIETALASILAKIIAAPATEAKQDSQISATASIGTRAYGTPAARVAVGVATAYSSTIAATEVLLHASTRCFVQVVAATGTPAVTNDAIPLEAGEKFHLRLTSGLRIGVVRDTADGFLNIIPVA